MAKIFTIPEEFEAKVPQFSFSDFDYKGYQAKQVEFTAELKQWLIKRNPKKYVGETISFQVADGYAMYMVAAMKPLQLVHIPLGDAWEFQYAKNLTAKDVENQIIREEELRKIFS